LALENFAKTVFRAGRRPDGYMDLTEATNKYTRALGDHLDDREV
jgi:hypothetical protein